MTAFLKRQDWFLNAAVLFLAAASLVTLSSINRSLFWQQLIWFAIGFSIIIFFTRIDWRPLTSYKWVILGFYLFALLLLVATYFLAPVIRSTRSWLVVGPVQIQTSEIAKIALIILLASFFARGHVGIARWNVLLKSFLYFIIPTALILVQPDLGSALILFAIWLGLLLVSGIRWRHLFIGFIIFSLLFGLGWKFMLENYQKNRITAFLNPSSSPLDANYNVIQSKIAIGSAGFFGKGYGQGTQVQLGFLPEAKTDFIFPAFVEEWGSLGGFLVIGVFVLMLLRIIKIGIQCHDNFSRLICLGTVIMFLSQFTINVGSALGLLPVVGVTLPFFSYGGSSILANAMLIGIIQSTVVRSSFLRRDIE
ncbi:MAG: Rod shape-determining protein RodA [Parcubacteria group bacterium GW2011_GWA1_48_11b]|nr:MAG: Rod shape-determining protein RodA [Parcubacteria group bacterium GW2011_GWA1_48_11b]